MNKMLELKDETAQKLLDFQVQFLDDAIAEVLFSSTPLGRRVVVLEWLKRQFDKVENDYLEICKKYRDLNEKVEIDEKAKVPKSYSN